MLGLDTLAAFFSRAEISFQGQEIQSRVLFLVSFASFSDVTNLPDKAATIWKAIQKQQKGLLWKPEALIFNLKKKDILAVSFGDKAGL